MGLYDRDYVRREEPGVHLGGIETITTKIVLFTVGVYLVQLLTNSGLDGGWFNRTFQLHADIYRRPWLAYGLLTYGFLHSVTSIQHILFNMLVLWFLGREVETRYGKREFLTFYLTAIVVAGIAWSASQFFRGQPNAVCWGASGGVSAVLVLFALNFPKRQLLVWFVLPVPAWALALFVVLTDIWGSVTRPDQVGYEAHLGGAAFALVYFKLRWRISALLPGLGGLPNIRRGPKLRVHRPGPEDEPDDIDRRVDDILRKIREQGQDSLTRQERRILEKASREYQRRQR